MADKISIYAELLPNIRQVSVVANLPSPSDASTRALLISDGTRIHVTHRGKSQLLELPGVAGAGPSGLLPLAPGPKQTWRLPLLVAAAPGGERSSVPWEAVRMGAGSMLRCRACRAVLLPADAVAAWRDLPSANWAEMMEFWHCHKPDDHDGHGHGHGHDGGPVHAGATAEAKADQDTLARRGYGASVSMRAQQGVGLVDLMSFLLAREDCVGVEIPSHSDAENSAVRFMPARCASCLVSAGYFHIRAPAVTLHKWRVLVDSPDKGCGPPPTVTQCLAASLLAAVARSGSSKCLVVPMSGLPSEGLELGGKALHLWVLNSTISYTSTLGGHTRRPAIKLLFKVVGEDEARKMLESFSTDAQDISMPREAVEAVADALEQSNLVIPEGDRTFQGWQVGLLEKWESG